VLNELLEVEGDVALELAGRAMALQLLVGGPVKCLRTQQVHGLVIRQRQRRLRIRGLPHAHRVLPHLGKSL
jgi:hypothetical protein